jgi:DNA-directed RNA polymerase subunit RPC12/RpoP
MPTLTHILAAALVLVVVLIHAVWRRWHQAPPMCEACGRHNCPGGCECVAHPPDPGPELPAFGEWFEGDDQECECAGWKCPHCGKAWLSSEPDPGRSDGVDCPDCGALIADEELVDDMAVWKRVCEGSESKSGGK